MRDIPLTITKHLPEHTPALRRIFRDARRHAFTWEDPAQFDLMDFDLASKGEEILVAMENETPIGFIAWWPPQNFVHSLFVDPASIGKGAGKQLLKACLEKMGRPASLKCLQANQNALAFYKAQGWEIQSAGETTDGAYYVLAVN